MSQSDEMELILRPLITDEFLSTLTIAARVSGWSHDYYEILSFVEWCYELAGKPIVDLTPYENG